MELMFSSYLYLYCIFAYRDNQKKLIVTPVRRSTRLSRSAYTSTPGIKMCSSLRELDSPDRSLIDFQNNKALY